MTRRPLAKVLTAAALAVGVTLTLSLTGCVGIAGNLVERALANSTAAPTPQAKGSAADKPVAGECWTATFAGQAQNADWFGGPPVNCASAHQLYTFAVLKLRRSHPGPEFNSKDYLETAIHNDAFDTCYEYQVDHYGDLDQTTYRLKLKTFVPRRVQWNAGARWVRCDFGILALGSLVKSPKLSNLPAAPVLEREISNQPDRFNFCVDVPGGDPSMGPKSDSAVFASCDKHPDWELQAYLSYPGALTASYPSAAEFAAQYLVKCEQPFADATHSTYPYYPTREQWDAGTTQTQCWVGRK